MRLLSTALIICCTIIAACSPDMVEPQLQGHIQGTVTNAESGEPMSGVSVETTPATEALATNGNGEFSFKNVPTGSYQVKASKPNFETKSVMIMVNEGRTSSAVIQLIPRENEDKSKQVKTEVITWKQTAPADSSYINVEYRFSNTSDTDTISEFEVYFDIITDKRTFYHEVNNTDLSPGEQNIGSFRNFLEDAKVDTVVISGLWINDSD